MIMIIIMIMIMIIIIMIIIIIIIIITIIIITFRTGHIDQYAISLLERIKEDSSSTSVIFITHRTNEMFHPLMSTIEKIITRNQTTYMFLGEHTHNTAKKIVSEYDSDFSILSETIENSVKLEISVNSNFTNSANTDFKGTKFVKVGDPRSFDLSHFYPVVPKEYFMRCKKSIKMRNIIDNKFKDNTNNNNNNNNNDNDMNNNNNNNNNNKSYEGSNDNENNIDNNDINNNVNVNSITGNNTNENIELNDEYFKIKNNEINFLKISLKKLETLEIEKEKNIYHPFFVVQGNFGGKHSHRKDPLGTLNCLRKLEDKLRIESMEKQKEKETEKETEKERHKLKRRKRSNSIRRKVIEENLILNNSIINDEEEKNSNNTKIFIKKSYFEIDRIENKPILSVNEGNESYFSPREMSLKSLSIDLVGHLNGKVEVGKLRTGKVRFLSDLSSKDYYDAISKVKEL